MVSAIMVAPGHLPSALSTSGISSALSLTQARILSKHGAVSSVLEAQWSLSSPSAPPQATTSASAQVKGGTRQTHFQDSRFGYPIKAPAILSMPAFSQPIPVRPLRTDRALRASAPPKVVPPPVLSGRSALDKSLPVVHRATSQSRDKSLDLAASGMPTPPQTPDARPTQSTAWVPTLALDSARIPCRKAVSSPSSLSSTKWISSFCKRRPSIPKTLKKLVRASFAASTTTIFADVEDHMEQRDGCAAEAGPSFAVATAAAPLEEEADGLASGTLMLHFDPVRGFVSISRPARPERSLDTISPVDSRLLVSSPSPFYRPEGHEQVRRRRKSRKRIGQHEVAQRSILKPCSQFDAVTPCPFASVCNVSATKRFRFNEQVLVGETWPKGEYERDSYAMLMLTPQLAAEIKTELNAYKRDEMAVHAQSQCHTHFFH